MVSCKQHEQYEPMKVPGYKLCINLITLQRVIALSADLQTSLHSFRSLRVKGNNNMQQSFANFTFLIKQLLKMVCIAFGEPMYLALGRDLRNFSQTLQFTV